LTISQAIEYFLLDQRLRGNTDKTITGYQTFLNLFLDWSVTKGTNDLESLTLYHVQGYQLYIDTKPHKNGGKQKLSKRSVQTYIRHVKIFLKYCYSEGFLSEPIHQKIKLPKAEKPVIEILTDDEISEILSCFSKSETGLRNTALILLLLDCGLRLAELTKIKSEHINFDKGYMIVTGKGRKERMVPIGLKVRRSMLAYMHKRRSADSPEDDQYFFLTDERKRITKSCVASLMGRLKKSSGVSRLHAHLFRHTFATNFLVHGIGDVYELSRLLGHSEIRTTEKYLQIASFYIIISKRKKLSYLDIKK